MGTDQLTINIDAAKSGSEQKKRIEWVDIAKCICIVFVMLSHLGDLEIAPELRLFYTNFYLTGFFFASGYVYRFVPGFLTHIKKKIRQLFIPWLLFSVANIVLSYLLTFSPDGHNNFWTELARNFLQVRGYSDGMWFVAALFTAYIFFYLFIKCFETSKAKNGRKAIRVFVLIAAVLFFANMAYSALMPKEIFPWKSNCLPWHLEYVPYALYFMFAGYLFRQYFETGFDSFFSVGKAALVIVLYLVMAYIPHIFNLTMPWYAQALYSFVETNLAVSMLILISKRIRPNKYLLFVGRNTLAYFGMHGKLLALCEAVFIKISPSLYNFVICSHFLSAVYSIIMGIAFSVILIIPAMIINKYLPFMVGKTYKRGKEKQKFTVQI